MDRKAGINSGCLYGVDPVDALDYIVDAGFSSIFTGAYDSKKVEKIKSKADKNGIEVEFIHAPFDGINKLWMAGVDHWDIKNRIIQSIDAACDNDIPAIILHVSSGWNPPEISDIGLARYDAMVEYAMKKNVIVAFENLRKTGNLAYLMDRYAKVENVKFCYDCGHEHCYTKTVPMLDLFYNKLICTHIHDNVGKLNDEGDFDYHFLPFDGNIDYQKMVDKLDEYGYTGSIMLEVFNGKKEEYLQMTNEEFVRECYSRYERINALSRK